MRRASRLGWMRRRKILGDFNSTGQRKTTDIPRREAGQVMFIIPVHFGVRRLVSNSHYYF
jgi:hypothetical protein